MQVLLHRPMFVASVVKIFLKYTFYKVLNQYESLAMKTKILKLLKIRIQKETEFLNHSGVCKVD